MKKVLGMLGMFLLLFSLICPGQAQAADVVWQLLWQDNGTLQEQVRVEGRELTAYDTSWNSTREGDYQVLRREAASWQVYQQLPDRLPLEINERYFVFGQITYLSVAGPPAGGLWQQLQGLAGFHVTIGAPGYMKIAATDEWAELQYSWDGPNINNCLPAGNLARIVTVDGFLSAVTIVLIAMLFIGISFMNRMKKAEQIILEEFALTPPEEEPAPSTEID